ncbi:hypothetical protein NECAME_02223 [Necator americanus]|uniref:Activin types I and II receptor domain protein n=1 Tax=Necator americanus TaxID=51031 RepID=W2TGK9_NECAM|nr:hypothetical protein NECAME_02223 [Necator americanus]ETN81180.1 hypothetical protein NECAME_02223 [Necator americanus]
MIALRYFIALTTLLCCCLALECYTGFKYIKGRSVGTSKKTCEHSTDYCYNATADLTQLNEISMAGCSTTRCFLSHNKCITQMFQGHEIKFCCCNTGDLCNSKFTVKLLLFLRILRYSKKQSKKSRIGSTLLDSDPGEMYTCMYEKNKPSISSADVSLE